jgi:UDP-N-acetylglucosamine 2-epimerase (non-hydrolysing)
MNILVAFGTRPEAVKLAPLILELRRSEGIRTHVCITGQHRDMVSNVLDFFGVHVDSNLDIMRPDQTLNEIASRAVVGFDAVLEQVHPEWTIVQGDTTTAFACAFSSFNRRVKVAHVEAGLRSFDRNKPFPEEMNRVLVGALANVHFCPTVRASDNLISGGVPARAVHVVGNTVIDALKFAIKRLEDTDARATVDGQLPKLKDGRHLVLVTGHRRENFGAPFRELCEAIRYLATTESVDIVYPVHLNPNVRAPVYEILGGHPNIHLIEPVGYPALVRLAMRSRFILTDSGGIQEEAAALGRPVLVTRDVTERQESVDAGVSRLVGTRTSDIVEWSGRLLHDDECYRAMARAIDIYGDGKTSARIVELLKHTPGEGA